MLNTAYGHVLSRNVSTPLQVGESWMLKPREQEGRIDIHQSRIDVLDF